MKNKYFLIDVTICDGEHEHKSGGIIAAKNELEAKKIYDNKIGEGYFDFGDGLTVLRCNGIRQISKKQVETLEKLQVRYRINRG